MPDPFVFTGPMNMLLIQPGNNLSDPFPFIKQTIRTILTNPVYIGTLVQIRAGDKIYRNGERHHIEPDEVITVEHTHEPIISEDLFYRVSTKIEEKRKKILQRYINHILDYLVC